MAGESKGRRESARLVVAATMMMAACAAGDPSSARPGPTASVEALIGDAACDSDSQCHTIGVGAKACGGPQRYLAWSSRRTEGAALQSAAEREARAARAQAESAGIMSNCAFVTDPGAYCTVPDAAGANAASASPTRSPTARQCRVRASGSGGVPKIY